MKDKYIVMFTGLQGMLNKGDTGPRGHCWGGHGPVTPREAGSWELPASSAGPDNPSLGPQQGLTQQRGRAGPVGRDTGDRMGLESSCLCSWSLSGLHQGQGGPAPLHGIQSGCPELLLGLGQVWGPQEVLLVPVGWVTVPGKDGQHHSLLLWDTP